MRDEIYQTIKEMLEKKTKKIVDLKSNLRALGLDSLDFFDLILDLEEKWKIKIEDERLINLNTVEDVVNEIYNLLN